MYAPTYSDHLKCIRSHHSHVARDNVFFRLSVYGNSLYVSVIADQERIIIFKEPIPNKVLEGHIIRKETVLNEGSCRVLCYMDPNCVSINVGPSEGGQHKCELNDATSENKKKKVTHILKNMEGYTHLAMEVTFCNKSGFCCCFSSNFSSLHRLHSDYVINYTVIISGELMEQELHVLRSVFHGQFLLRTSQTFNNRSVTSYKATETIRLPSGGSKVKVCMF